MAEDIHSEDFEELTRMEGASSDDTPQVIGSYRLVQKIGEGGMGEVWLAQQAEPVQRRVALKIIKHGMDTKQVIARFEVERQALALMDHPVVAKVFDAGMTPRGRPFFAMEYVAGVPLTEHCDRYKLGTRERLELFIQICEGVQHAHQKAIIHRDLKPSNVLVEIRNDRPLPKIIDFGVAKATGAQLTDRTMVTELGVLIGTPEYMSPEQAEMTGQGVDTRTDVYSLGVILYELLTGELPLDSQALRQGGVQGIPQKIRDEQPQKPSTRLTRVDERTAQSAILRKTDRATLKRQLAGDLDWITLKALEKDRTMRYGSPAELAADIRRHLEDLPVVAGPPSVTYRASKFVRRHKIGVAFAALVVLSLGVGIVGSTINLVRARRAEALAKHESMVSERVSTFLADLLGDVDPERAGRTLLSDLKQRVAAARKTRGDDPQKIAEALVRFDELMAGVNATDSGLRLIDEEILAQATSTIERELRERPEISGRLYRTIGSTYLALGLHEPAERLLKEALVIHESALGPEHADTLRSEIQLGLVYQHRGRDDESQRQLERTRDTATRVLGEDHPVTLFAVTALATGYQGRGRYAEAEALQRKTYEIQQRTLGSEHIDTLRSMNALANTFWRQGRQAEAEAMHREALATERRVLGSEHPYTLASMNNLANVCSAQSRYDEAERLHREVLEVRRRALGEDHPLTLASMSNLSNAIERQGRFAEAEKLQKDVLAGRRRVLGPAHPQTLTSMINLATVYTGQSRLVEAEALFRESLEVQLRVLGENHPNVAGSWFNVACISALQGRSVQALAELRRSVASGWTDADWMTQDENLESIRHLPEFDAIVELARRGAASQRVDGGPDR